jgi:hypothetical protein
MAAPLAARTMQLTDTTVTTRAGTLSAAWRTCAGNVVCPCVFLQWCGLRFVPQKNERAVLYAMAAMRI